MFKITLRRARLTLIATFLCISAMFITPMQAQERSPDFKGKLEVTIQTADTGQYLDDVWDLSDTYKTQYLIRTGPDMYAIENPRTGWYRYLTDEGMYEEFYGKYYYFFLKTPEIDNYNTGFSLKKLSDGTYGIRNHYSGRFITYGEIDGHPKRITALNERPNHNSQKFIITPVKQISDEIPSNVWRNLLTAQGERLPITKGSLYNKYYYQYMLLPQSDGTYEIAVADDNNNVQYLMDEDSKYIECSSISRDEHDHTNEMFNEDSLSPFCIPLSDIYTIKVANEKSNTINRNRWYIYTIDSKNVVIKNAHTGRVINKYSENMGNMLTLAEETFSDAQKFVFK